VGAPGTCQFSGSDNATFLVVGSGPGASELGGEPFVGASGSLLWSTGLRVGLQRHDCRILNVSRCSPCGAKGKSLSQAQIGACWDDFNEAVRTSQARVVICLGGDALRRVTGLSGLDDYRGFLFSADQIRSQDISLPTLGAYKTSQKCKLCAGKGCVGCKDGYKFRKGDEKMTRMKVHAEPVLPPNVEWIIATYEPISISRANRKTLRAFVNDLGRAVRAARGDLDIKRYTYTDVPRVVVDDKSSDILAFDIENDYGLNGKINRIGMASSQGVWSAAWSASVREAAKYALGEPGRLKVAHNIQHDMRHLEAEGVMVEGPIFDTMWGGMTLEPDLPMGLRSMAPLWLDLHGCWKDESQNNPAWYNAQDNGITYDLGKVLIARHKEIGSYGALMKFIMPSLRVLMDMHRRGMKVDLAWLGQFSAKLHARRNRIERLWRENTPYSSEILSRPLDISSLLYYTLEMSMIRDPDNDNRPTTAAWALQILMKRYPQHRDMLRCLLAYRKLEKLQAATAVALGPDGCVHPHYGPQWKDSQDEGGDGMRAKRKGTTSTLRLAVGADSGLNLQQIPNIARRIYVAPEGYVFLKADIDRAEPWVYAVRSGDRTLISELTNGDPYQRLADKANCSRDAGKILFLARTYGAGARKGKMILAKKGIDAPQADVERIFKVMANEYATLEAYRAGIMRTATTAGRLYSGFGFMREFLGGDRDATEAADWEAQHHVALILWSLLVPLHEFAKSLGGWLQTTVYDEVLLCVPQGTEKQAAAGMLDIIRTERPEIAPGFRPSVSEVLTGTNWRDLA